MLIFTGRFQPFHKGHLSVIEYLSDKYPDEIICVAIIKDFPFLKEKNDFDKRVDGEMLKKEKALNAETTLYIITQVLKNRNYRNVVTTLMPRASDESWKVVDFLFDCKRVWVFTDNQYQMDSWERLKSRFFTLQNEDILWVPIEKSISGTEIRTLLKNRSFEMLEDILPKEVIDFYKQM